MKRWSIALVLLVNACGDGASAAPRRIHVFVAFVDIARQGIAPEPAKTGHTTEQIMCPGFFRLRDALEVWPRKGSRPEIRMAAARAYAANQSISVKAAAGVFSKLE
ncbi:hypothetical protein [Prosthecobacter sp.]|uniref:hypothetical protein n=1 Tax=Prosthecobacter sp. TaxID=1965333 RepID=UPI00378477A6